MAPTAADLAPYLAVARSIPKCELHAHLNGSIRRSTLHELAIAAGIDPAAAHIVEQDPRCLSDMFDVFSVIHRAVRGAEAVRRVSREILEDMQADGIVYAEIRTTPRAHTEHGLGKEAYVKAVLAGWEDYYATHGHHATEGSSAVHARLLLSLDRRDQASEHQDTVRLALALRAGGEKSVLGIDLSGDPTKGSWVDWESALQQARGGGLRVTIHAGEVGGHARWDAEMQQVLDFRPDRLGHVCFISDENLARLKQLAIPLELCLTSNVLSNSVSSYREHHFRLHHQQHKQYQVNESESSGNLVVLCTDDSAVFGSSLSREYAIAQVTFALSDQDMWQLAANGVEASFLDEDEAKGLREYILKKKKEYGYQ